MIRFARPDDRAALMGLWQEAFGDSPEDTAYYFDHRHRDENLLLFEQSGEVAGMLTMLPAIAWAGTERFPIRYIYAVATAVAHRKQGISTRLLEHAHAWMQAHGILASVLAPATPALFEFYGNRGYQTYFHVDNLTVDMPAIASWQLNIPVTEATIADYARIRDRALANSRLYVQWDETALTFVFDSEKAGGSLILHAADGSMEAIAICQPQEQGHVRIVEMIANGLPPERALAAFHTRLKADRYTLRMPEGTWTGSTKTPLGMICPFAELPTLEGAPPYLGLIKD